MKKGNVTYTVAGVGLLENLIKMSFTQKEAIKIKDKTTKFRHKTINNVHAQNQTIVET